MAFDGLNSVKVPDSGRNRSWLGEKMTRLGLAGYPALRIVALAETVYRFKIVVRRLTCRFGG